MKGESPNCTKVEQTTTKTTFLSVHKRSKRTKQQE